MKLNVSKRTAERKSEAKKLRRENKIPAVLYSKGRDNENITVDAVELQGHLNHIIKGHLSTTIFTLVDHDGKERKALVKDIQYHITTYAISHLDFEEMHDELLVNIKVPIVPVGLADCSGIKLGGVLRQVIRSLKIRCLPKDIPANFKLDVTPLKMGDALRLRDIALPSNLRPLVTDMDEVAMVIVKR